MEIELVDILGKPTINDFIGNNVILFKIIDIENNYTFEIIFTILNDKFNVILHDEDKSKYNEDEILKLLIDKYDEQTLKEL